MILNKLNLLREILIERLPNIIMWNSVGVYFHGDSFPKNTLSSEDTDPEHFYIIWYGKKKEDNPHPFLSKEIPFTLDEINAVIKRQREKLRTESTNS